MGEPALLAHKRDRRAGFHGQMTVQSTRFLMLGLMTLLSDRRRQSAISTSNFCPLGAQEARVAARELHSCRSEPYRTPSTCRLKIGRSAVRPRPCPPEIVPLTCGYAEVVAPYPEASQEHPLPNARTAQPTPSERHSWTVLDTMSASRRRPRSPPWSTGFAASPGISGLRARRDRPLPAHRRPGTPELPLQ
jgi:hypothetical protein